MICLYVFNIFNVNVSFARIDPSDYKPSEPNEAGWQMNKLKNIIGAFQAIGSIVSVLALVLIGIKYMTGSVEQKAEYKSTMINYVIGAVLVFAITNISAIIYSTVHWGWGY